MRLAFAVASHVNPDVLLLDEVLAVGDEAFQRKCFGRIFDFRRRGGTLVFVSHDPAAVERVCDRAVLLVDGGVIADGAARRRARQRTTACSRDGGRGGRRAPRRRRRTRGCSGATARSSSTPCASSGATAPPTAS